MPGIDELELRLKELEEALKLINEGRAKRFFLSFGGSVFIEVDEEYAREYIERRILALKAAGKRSSP
ncbi:MAG: hypothetical protein GSR86_00690 [Desulfurococcales archaeon]|nr:hypothetical protein [Desulfurococcales archaeon]